MCGWWVCGWWVMGVCGCVGGGWWVVDECAERRESPSREQTHLQIHHHHTPHHTATPHHRTTPHHTTEEDDGRVSGRPPRPTAKASAVTKPTTTDTGAGDVCQHAVAGHDDRHARAGLADPVDVCTAGLCCGCTQPIKRPINALYGGGCVDSDGRVEVVAHPVPVTPPPGLPLPPI